MHFILMEFSLGFVEAENWDHVWTWTFGLTGIKLLAILVLYDIDSLPPVLTERLLKMSVITWRWDYQYR